LGTIGGKGGLKREMSPFLVSPLNLELNNSNDDWLTYLLF